MPRACGTHAWHVSAAVTARRWTGNATLSTVIIRRAAPIACAAAGWATLAVLSYFWLRIEPVLGMGGWIGVLLLPVAGTVPALAAVGTLLQRRRFVTAALIVVLGAVAVWGWAATDWPRTYVDSQVAMNRAALTDLADQYRSGKITEGASVPARLHGLAADGVAHVREGALYLTTYQDWRAERGAGIAWFASPPPAGMLLATADGDIGEPVRDLGGGWWWMA
jgi:hypothetical protein